jgi:hypothetical protein
MYGTRGTRRKNGTLYVYDKYICSTYHTQGKGKCGHHAVDQSVLTDFIIAKLRETILAGGDKDEMRKSVRQRLTAKKAVKPAQTDALRKKVAELDRALEQGTKRVLSAPDDVADLLAEELSKTRKERERVAVELERNVAQQKPIDVEAEIEATVAHLWALATELNRTKPERLRELFNRIVQSIPDSPIFRLVSRDDRI